MEKKITRGDVNRIIEKLWEFILKEVHYPTDRQLVALIIDSLALQHRINGELYDCRRDRGMYDRGKRKVPHPRVAEDAEYTMSCKI